MDAPHRRSIGPKSDAASRSRCLSGAELQEVKACSLPGVDVRADSYSRSRAGATFRILSLIASLTPFRYPVPNPTIHAVTAQPKMNTHVKPVGIAHTICITAPLGSNHQLHNNIHNGSSSNGPANTSHPAVPSRSRPPPRTKSRRRKRDHEIDCPALVINHWPCIAAFQDERAEAVKRSSRD
jgi:hypothetical protein